MKRKTVLFILIAALLAFAVHAADTVNIRLDELGMSLDVPADCSVFTRNMSPDDPALAEYGIDLEQLNQLMAERSIYLDLLSDDPLPENFQKALEGEGTSVSIVAETDTGETEQEIEVILAPVKDGRKIRGVVGSIIET